LRAEGIEVKRQRSGEAENMGWASCVGGAAGVRGLRCQREGGACWFVDRVLASTEADGEAASVDDEIDGAAGVAHGEVQGQRWGLRLKFS